MGELYIHVVSTSTIDNNLPCCVPVSVLIAVYKAVCLNHCWGEGGGSGSFRFVNLGYTQVYGGITVQLKLF